MWRERGRNVQFLQSTEIRYQEKLNFFSAKRIRLWSERVTALAHLKLGYNVFYQIEIGSNVIDFFMKQGPEDPGFLLEVTSMTEDMIAVSGQKQRQIESMQRSGLPFFVYSDENIRAMGREFNIH